MNILVWNCCRLGNLRTRKEFGYIIQAKDLSVMFIAETLIDKVRLDTVLRNIDFDHKWMVPREGRGGGLALFWKSSVNLTIDVSSKYFINTCIDKNSYNAWRFTGFYGEPETSSWIESWDSL